MKNLQVIIAALILLMSTQTYAQEFKVNTDESSIKWEGKKIGGAHNGHILIKEGTLTLQENQLTKGVFLIDMKSITNMDIEGDEYKNKLVGHLKSDDFFAVEKFPTAQLKITNSKPFVNNKAKLTGDLTIKGKTAPIEFEVTKIGNTYSTVLTIDRSKYDVRYGSKSFFDNLGDKVIYDEFTLDVKLIAFN
jgi:polyisoprenoid-binding protein YceI